MPLRKRTDRIQAHTSVEKYGRFLQTAKLLSHVSDQLGHKLMEVRPHWNSLFLIIGDVI